MKRYLIIGVSTVALCTSAYADQFSYLEGKWTPTTGAGPNIGQPIWFHEAMGGWDAVFGWWGQTSISRSGEYASHVRIDGSHGERCFYYISPINNRKMAWNLNSVKRVTVQLP